MSPTSYLCSTPHSLIPFVEIGCKDTTFPRYDKIISHQIPIINKSHNSYQIITDKL